MNIDSGHTPAKSLRDLRSEIQGLQKENKLPNYVKIIEGNKLQPINAFSHLKNRIITWAKARLGKPSKPESFSLKEYTSISIIQICKIDNKSSYKELAEEIDLIAKKVGITSKNQNMIKEKVKEANEALISHEKMKNQFQAPQKPSNTPTPEEKILPVNIPVPQEIKPTPPTPTSEPENTPIALTSDTMPDVLPLSSTQQQPEQSTLAITPELPPANLQVIKPEVIQAEVNVPTIKMKSFKSEMQDLKGGFDDSFIKRWCHVGTPQNIQLARAHWLGAVVHHKPYWENVEDADKQLEKMVDFFVAKEQLDSKQNKEFYSNLIKDRILQMKEGIGSNFLLSLHECVDKHPVGEEQLKVHNLNRAHKMSSSFVRRAMLTLILQGRSWDVELEGQQKKTTLELAQQVHEGLVQKIENSKDYFEKTWGNRYAFKASGGDGDCFYHSVIGQLTREDIDTIRKKVGDKRCPLLTPETTINEYLNCLQQSNTPLSVADLRRCYAAYIALPNDSPGVTDTKAKLAREHEGVSGWGTDADAKRMAQFLEKPLVIESPIEAQRIGVDLLSDSYTGTRPLYFLYNGAYHWDSFAPRTGLVK
jgi:hypothetical protein